ncbi:HECT-type ubiquitin ligase-interacting protein apyA [Aspergillus californicus]
MALHRLKAETASVRDHVDIQLDKSHIVFHGCEQEALAVYLSGNLILRLKESTTIKHIRLHLSGMRRLSSLPSRAGWKKSLEEQFYTQTWEFHDLYRATPEVLASGEHTYPFNVVLEGSLPETLEGFKDAAISYNFRAEIGRKQGKDMHLRKPLRVIRVPTPGVGEITLDEIWAEKIAYRIDIPSKVVAFGTCLDVNYLFSPVVQDLKIEYIESQLVEVREVAIDSSDLSSGRPSSTTILASDRYTIDDSTKSLAGYQFSRSLPLPKTLGHCVQDIDTMGIKVKHQLKIIARMQNPDGHCSELRLTIPVSVYLSPYYPAWEGASFVAEAIPLPLVGDSEEAPPAYGQHELDRVYSGFGV